MRRPSILSQSLHGLLLGALACLSLGACSDSTPAARPFAIEAPGDFERDYDLNQEAARRLEEGPLGALVASARRQESAPLRSSLSGDFEGRLAPYQQGAKLDQADLEIHDLGGESFPSLNADAFAKAWVGQVQSWRRFERANLGIERLMLSTDPEQLDAAWSARAVGELQLEIGGEYPRGDRCSLRVRFAFEAVKPSGGSWLLRRLDARDGERVRGTLPPFRSISAEAGFDYHLSARNAEMTQSFVDEQRTLALGGLSALDWNGDGFWDLLGTRKGQQSTLFLNDGAGGFVPAPLPVDAPREAASFLLYVDLDGDDKPELVSSEVLSYDGESAHCGLYSQGGGFWNLDEKAFRFPNPVGLRRIAIQTLVPFDANGDGLLDLFFAVYGTAESRRENYNSVESHDGADNHLFINQGNLTFVEESEARGIHGTQYTYVATAFDFDGDGDQDLFEGNDFGPNRIWLNDGEGNFSEDSQTGIGGVSAYSMGATLADWDNSGQWSLYVSNMSSAAGARMVDLPGDLDPAMRERVRTIASGNRLFHQQSDGTWQEQAQAAHCADAGWAWGSVFADLDNDADLDLMVTNGFTSHSDANLPDWQPWYWRQVLDDAQALQDGRQARDANAALGPFRGSFNGHEHDRYYHNPGGHAAGQLDATASPGRFIEAAYVRGLDLASDGRSVIPVDVDGDGDLDLALWTLQGLELLENRAARGNFARIELAGQGGMAGTLGAIVEVSGRGVTQRQVHRLVEGFQSQVPGHLHFGMGGFERLEEVRVTWPSGEVSTWKDLPTGQILRLVEGEAEAQPRPLPSWPESSRPRGSQPSVDTFARRIGGGSESLARSGVPTVLRVAHPEGDPWPSADKLQRGAPNLRMVLLLPGEEAERGLGEHPWAAFTLDRGLVGQLFGDAGVVRPATFLFDSQGRLARSFLREVSDLEILGVLSELNDESPFPDLLVEAGRRALAQGRFRDARELFQTAVVSEAQKPEAFDGLARAHRMLSRPDLAEEAYRRSVQLDPDYALGHYNLGSTLVASGSFGQAEASYREVLRIEPDSVRAHLALAEVLLLQEEPGQAVEAYRAALQHLPEQAVQERGRALTDLGKLLGQMQRLDESRSVLLEAINLEDDNGEARRALDLVERLMGQGE